MCLLMGPKYFWNILVSFPNRGYLVSLLKESFLNRLTVVFIFHFQGSLPIYSSKISVSVVDNVLLVHEVDAKVVILYDIFSDSRAPISAPLPLLLRSYPRAITASSQSNTRDAETSEANDLSDIEAVIYGDGWTFLVPDLICDAANGLLWKIHLDLEVITF